MKLKFFFQIDILVVNRGQPTPNHVITRPLLLTHHHTNSSPAHLVLSTASSKVFIFIYLYIICS